MNSTKTPQESTVETLIENISESLPELPGLVKTGLSKAFEILLNQLIDLDEEQGEAFKALDKKTFQVTLKDFAQTFFIIYNINDDKGSFSVQSHLIGTPNSHIKTNLKELMQQSDTSEITGDIDLGKTFIFGLQQLDIDWEEQLSRITGDLVAFKVGHAAREAHKTTSSAQQKISETLKEYLQFEVNLLPTKLQVNHFNRQVEQTEQAIDILEARINTLASKKQKN